MGSLYLVVYSGWIVFKAPARWLKKNFGYLFSDDNQILDLIKKKYISNVYAIQRSAKLSDDKAILSDVIIDCIHRLADEGMICVDDYLGGSFILLQPSSPIRLKNDLVNFCSQIRDLGDYHSVVSVNKRYKVIKDVYEVINKSEVNSDFFNWVHRSKIDFMEGCSK